MLAESGARIDKERAMRRRQLKWLWSGSQTLPRPELTREELLMKLGAAQHEGAGRLAAWSRS